MSAIDEFIAAAADARYRVALDVMVTAARRRGVRLGMGTGFIEASIEVGRHYVDQLHAVVESPIERDMATALVFSDYSGFSILTAGAHIVERDKDLPRLPVVIIPQMKIMNYRLDFAVLAHEGKHGKLVAVECDGAEFHVDPRKDARRDRTLAELGIETVRFSGSHIFKDAAGLALSLATDLERWRAAL